MREETRHHPLEKQLKSANFLVAGISITDSNALGWISRACLLILM